MKRLLLFAALAFGVAAGDPSTETVHEVEEGETLKGIANRAGVPEVVIAEANGLSEPYVVKLGQKLVIPRQRTHSVRPGDTLSGIARRYNISVQQLRSLNGIASDRIEVGQVINLPE